MNPACAYFFAGDDEPEVLLPESAPEQIEDLVRRYGTSPFRAVEIASGLLFFFDLDADVSEIIARVDTAAGRDAALAIADSLCVPPKYNQEVS